MRLAFLSLAGSIIASMTSPVFEHMEEHNFQLSSVFAGMGLSKDEIELLNIPMLHVSTATAFNMRWGFIGMALVQFFGGAYARHIARR